MKKVQWREGRTDGRRTEGHNEGEEGRDGRSCETAEKAINLERFVCCDRDREREREREREGDIERETGRRAESIVSFRPNCSAVSRAFFCTISPLGD